MIVEGRDLAEYLKSNKIKEARQLMGKLENVFKQIENVQPKAVQIVMKTLDH